jgi:hypothetical protein
MQHYETGKHLTGMIRLLGLLFLYAPGLMAQDTLALKGKVIDLKYGDVVPYAHVFISGSSLGTVSNEAGKFRLLVPGKMASDSLTISSIGFTPATFSVAEVLASKQTNFTLTADTHLLNEVVILPTDPFELIQEAIDKIPVNYRTSPGKQQIFYREMARTDTSYITFSEAVLEVYKAPYAKTDTSLKDQIKVLKGRSKVDKNQQQAIEESSGLELKGFSGGPYWALDLDLVRYPQLFYGEEEEGRFKHFFNPKSKKFYDYHFEGVTSYRGKPAYVVTFERGRNFTNKLLFNGKVIIDEKSKAFVSIEYQLDKKSKNKIVPGGFATRALLRLFGIKYDLFDISGKQTYRPYNGKWDLYYSKGNLKMYLKAKRRKSDIDVNSTFTLRQELLVTEQDEGKVSPIPVMERLEKDENIISRFDAYDPDFWKNYTILEKETSKLDSFD